MYDDLIYVNSNYLLNLKPKMYKLPIITLILLLVLVIVSFIYKTYDTKVVIGYISCQEKCYLDIKVDLNLVSKLDDVKFIEVNNKKIDIICTDISEVLADNNSLNYQIIKYKLDIHEYKSLFYEVKLYYNKDLIIKKIINIFLES